MTDIKPINGVPLMVTLNGETTTRVESLEHLLARPARTKASLTLRDSGGFIRYVNEHKLHGATAIFYDTSEAGAVFLAVIDYHAGAGSLPAWGEHTAALVLSQTVEWKRWMRGHDMFMSQVDFATFLEDNGREINLTGDEAYPTMIQMIEQVGPSKVGAPSGRLDTYA